MRIAIDVTPGTQGAGIGRYALGVAQAVAEHGAGIEVSAFTFDPRVRRAPELASGVDWIERPTAPRRARLEVALRYALAAPADGWFPSCDVFHATDHLLPPLRRVASVFTLHDLSCLRAPETQTTLLRTYSRLLLRRFAARADLVLAVSESTRRDALERFDLAPERVRTVLMATPRGFAPAPPAAQADARARHGLPARYLLAVGTLEPRKNHALLFRALADCPPAVRLVVVGRRGWKAEGILAALREAGVADRVRLAGFVPDADLPAVYSASAGFLFPSLYEGFGTPALEALACGVPVVASNTSSLPEVVGDAGLLLDPRDVAAWRDAMVRLWEGDAALLARREAGMARAATFTWSRLAGETIAAYREAHARRA